MQPCLPEQVFKKVSIKWTTWRDFINIQHISLKNSWNETCNGFKSRPNHNESNTIHMSSLCSAFSHVGCHLVLVGTCNTMSRLCIKTTQLKRTVRPLAPVRLRFSFCDEFPKSAKLCPLQKLQQKPQCQSHYEYWWSGGTITIPITVSSMRKMA